jgi:uncharacterized protein
MAEVRVPAGPMTVDWDVAVAMDDGVVLRADVFRPAAPGRYPVLLSYGPYAKGLAFQDGYPSAWQKDFHACIEWAGEQPWSSGKVGLSGVSYYGINQWLVAATQPKHLAAMCIWEGAADGYRDMTHHGGILSTFWANWYDMQVKTVQYGLGARGPRSRANPSLLVCGDETLSDAQLAANRGSFGDDILAHPLADDYHRERSAQWDRITVPFLSAGNWGGQGLHLRGNTEAFLRAASRHKWLELHGLEHWTHFYTDYGLALQKRFFGHFLKGEPTGWEDEPPVRLQVRHVDRFEPRCEREWPIARTRFTRMHLDPVGQALAQVRPDVEDRLAFDAQGDGLSFLSAPFAQDTELTGPVAAKLWVSSSTSDADLFLVLRVFTPDLREVTFAGAIDPHTPVAQGWLRASHRELDPELSREWRPYHSHRSQHQLVPGVPVELDIELWPTSIVVPAGCRIALAVRGRDYVYAERTGLKLSNFKNELRGCGPFLHDDPRDRPDATFAGRTTLHFGRAHPAWLLLPVIPPRQ